MRALAVKRAIFQMLCAAAILSLGTLGPPARAQQAADVILHNAKVLTVDKNFSIAEAVAVTGNKITAVGTNQAVLAQAGPNTLKIDLKGRTVIPGLIDTHLHINNQGPYEDEALRRKKSAYLVDWRGIRSEEDFLNQIKLLMEKNQPRPGEWLYFTNQVNFRATGTDTTERVKILYDDTTRWDLDKVTPNNPAVFGMGLSDENALLLNNKGFEIVWNENADFLKKYGRYWLGSNGLPDGHVEAPFSRLVLAKYAPWADAEDMADPVKKQLQELNAHGHTTISTKMRQNGIDTYKLLESRGELPVRLAYGMGWDNFGVITNLDDLQKYQKLMGTGSDMVWVNSMSPSSTDGSDTRACTNQKRVGGAFGVIDGWWPIGQCVTDSEFRGGSGRGSTISGNYFQDWILSMGRYGLRFANTHVAGDRTVANLLGFIEQVQKQYGPDATRNWAFDHCTMVDPKDFARAARLGVVFSCAPKYIREVAPAAAKSYGNEIANTFVVPVKSMMDAGIRVVYEADRFGDHYAWEDLEWLMTRKDINGNVWGPQERLDKATVLKMATIWAAEYILKPDKLGSIEVGKLADLAVLDKDYMAIPAEEVSKMQPQLTMMDGRILFVHSNFAKEYNLRPSGAVISTYPELKARRPATPEGAPR